MAAEAPKKMATSASFDFLAQSRGKRVIIEAASLQPSLQVERYSGTLEEVYDDSLLIRPDSGRRVLVFKHAIVNVSEA